MRIILSGTSFGAAKSRANCGWLSDNTTNGFSIMDTGLTVAIVSGVAAITIMAYPFIMSFLRKPDDTPKPSPPDSHKFGERVVRIETTVDSLKETAAKVGLALVEHDRKDDQMFRESRAEIADLRCDMNAGFKAVHEKIEHAANDLTKTVISALSGKKP